MIVTPRGIAIFKDLEAKAPHVVAEAKRTLQADRPLCLNFSPDEVMLCSLSIAARNELVLEFLIRNGLVKGPEEEVKG